MILHILVPDPDLRFSLKHIKQHKWFSIHTKSSTEEIKGIRVGFDQIKLNDEVLEEMEKDHGLDRRYTKKCLEANKHNAMTAHYFLLLKMKMLEKDAFNVISTGPPTKRLNKSIAAPRTTKNNYHLRKIAEGLVDLQLLKINNKQGSVNSSLENDASPNQLL